MCINHQTARPLWAALCVATQITKSYDMQYLDYRLIELVSMIASVAECTQAGLEALHSYVPEVSELLDVSDKRALV